MENHIEAWRKERRHFQRKYLNASSDLRLAITGASNARHHSALLAFPIQTLNRCEVNSRIGPINGFGNRDLLAVATF
jgi:hypothetical protein